MNQGKFFNTINFSLNFLISDYNNNNNNNNNNKYLEFVWYDSQDCDSFINQCFFYFQM